MVSRALTDRDFARAECAEAKEALKATRGQLKELESVKEELAQCSKEIEKLNGGRKVYTDFMKKQANLIRDLRKKGETEIEVRDKRIAELLSELMDLKRELKDARQVHVVGKLSNIVDS